MAYVEYNPNPVGRRVGDCVVRAIAKALNMPWEPAFITLVMNALAMGDMPSSDAVWGATLRQYGFYKHLLTEDITVEDFCSSHPEGVYVLALGGHVVTVVDGDLYDSWDSSKEIPLYYWSREGVM